MGVVEREAVFVGDGEDAMLGVDGQLAGYVAGMDGNPADLASGSYPADGRADGG